MSGLDDKPAGQRSIDDFATLRDEMVARHGNRTVAPMHVERGGLLYQRDRTHGDWRYQARMSQDLKDALFEPDPANRGEGPSAQQREAMHMICVKLARIACGDPLHADHWRDIAGYAELGLRDCKQDEKSS